MKAATKKSAPKKPAATKKAAPANAAAEKAPGSAAHAGPIQQQPQSKQQAATQAGLFLHTDDQWSLAYFNSGDLHCEERELFG